MSFDLLNYDFTFAWIYNSNMYRYLQNFLNSSNELKLLEIGSYEGLTACFLADTFLIHEKSSLITIDPFLPDETTKTQMGLETEQMCKNNLSKCLYPEKVKLLKMTSDEFFFNEAKTDNKFDFIYIDGSHEINQWLKDIENSFLFIKNQGIIWIDDYLGFDGKYKEIIKNKIIDLSNENKHTVKIINDAYQLGIQVFY